jgi:hypothetical protein
MYVRKKKNRSGSTNVVIVDKSIGKIRYLKTMETGSDAKTISELYAQGKKRVASCCGEQNLFEIHEKEREARQVTDFLLSNVEHILLNGVRLITDRYLNRLVLMR